MGGTDPDVARFVAAHLASLGEDVDDALASLANKGLVRRARKDLEKQRPTVVGADGPEAVLLDVEGSRVRIATPPTKSTCACGSGICRHVLAAIIHLRETAPAIGAGEPPQVAAEATASRESPAVAATPPNAVPPAADIGAALLALDEEAIRRWAGKPLFKKAAVVLARGADIADGPAVVVRLPAQNVTVRFLGGSLDAALCSCHAPGACEHKVAALLAYRAARTGRPAEVPQAMLEAAAGAARTREEVRASVRRTLGEMLALGTSRLSASTAQRLRTLAVSAHGVDLPRLERSLNALADDVSLVLKRDARASSAAVLAGAARAAALVAALARPTPAVVGEHRSTYLPVAGSMELVGLAAARWRTRSGYHGLTVYFWEPAAKRWTGWTDARPVGAPGFDPVRRFDEDGPWPGASGPRHAAMTRWRVAGAHRNAAGRLAARANTRGVPAGRASPADGPLLTDFAALDAVAEQAFAPGLADRREHANLVLLGPAAWADATYDPVRQEVTRFVSDAGGRAVPLLLRHAEETEHALTTLQHADAATLRAVLGFLRVGPAGLHVEPVTLWCDAKPIHLTLDGVPAAKAKAASIPAPDVSDDEEVDDLENADPEDVPAEHGDGGAGLQHVLALIEAEVLAVAEGGVAASRDLSSLRAAARQLGIAGMTTAAAAASRLCDDLERLRKSLDADESAAAESLLRCAYVVQLAFECATLTAARRATGPGEPAPPAMTAP
jgi:hypothetical protein